VGDVIVEVRGRRIDAASDVLAALADTSKGQSVTVGLVRAGKQRSLQATLSDEPLPSVFDSKWWRDFIKPLPPPDQTATPFEDEWLRMLPDWLYPTRPTNLRT
jgi:hypothetical protein